MADTSLTKKPGRAVLEPAIGEGGTAARHRGPDPAGALTVPDRPADLLR